MPNDNTTTTHFMALRVTIPQTIDDTAGTSACQRRITRSHQTWLTESIDRGLVFAVFLPVLKAGLTIERLEVGFVKNCFLDHIVEAAPLTRAERTEAQFRDGTRLGARSKRASRALKAVSCRLCVAEEMSWRKARRVTYIARVWFGSQRNLYTSAFISKCEHAFFFRFLHFI